MQDAAAASASCGSFVLMMDCAESVLSSHARSLQIKVLQMSPMQAQGDISPFRFRSAALLHFGHKKFASDFACL